MTEPRATQPRVLLAIRFAVLAAPAIALSALHELGRSVVITVAIVLAAAVLAHGLALVVRRRPRAAIGVLVAAIALGAAADVIAFSCALT